MFKPSKISRNVTRNTNFILKIFIISKKKVFICTMISDLTTTYNDLDINDKTIDLHPDLHITTSQTDEDFVNSYDFMSGESRSNNVVTTTVCV